MADDDVPYIPSAEEALGETQGSSAPSRGRMIDPDSRDHYVIMHTMEKEEPIKYRLLPYEQAEEHSPMSEQDAIMGGSQSALQQARDDYNNK